MFLAHTPIWVSLSTSTKFYMIVIYINALIELVKGWTRIGNSKLQLDCFRLYHLTAWDQLQLINLLLQNLTFSLGLLSDTNTVHLHTWNNKWSNFDSWFGILKSTVVLNNFELTNCHAVLSYLCVFFPILLKYLKKNSKKMH